MKQRSPSARGFTLAEIVVALALVSVTTAIGTKLLWTALGTTRDLQHAEQHTRSLDRLTSALRRDVERATKLEQSADKLLIGHAEWSIDGDAVIRKAGDVVESFTVPESTYGYKAKMWVRDGRCYFSVTGDDADATLTLKPIIGRGDR